MNILTDPPPAAAQEEDFSRMDERGDSTEFQQGNMANMNLYIYRIITDSHWESLAMNGIMNGNTWYGITIWQRLEGFLGTQEGKQ